LHLTLHDRAGTFASLLYKDKRLSVFLSVCIFCCHTANSVISALIDSGLGLCDSYGLWHKQVCFYKFLRPVCWAQEFLKDTAIVHFEFHFASCKFAKLVTSLQLSQPYYTVAQQNQHSMENPFVFIGTR